MAYDIVVVGGSLGGFQAVKLILGGLPREFPLPLAIVLHRGSDALGDLPGLLQRYSALPVADAEDKEPIMAGRVYVAPVGYHLMVESGSLALSTEAPVWFARPSIDVLFESAADTYAAGVIAVALTSSSPDGADGLVWVKQRGGVVVIQDPSSAESPILPRAALACTAVDHVLPLAEIAPFLVERSRSVARV